LKIGVISDTHDNLVNVRKAADIFNSEKVDLIIHLGDIIAPFTLAELASRANAKIEAIYGNNCGEQLGLKRIAEAYGVGIREPPYTLKVDNKKFLLVHGYGSPDNTVAVVRALADSGNWDAILYGHTHNADISYKKGILILNPGDAGGWLNKPSIAIVDSGSLKAKLVWLE